ncbi:hypothetical protein VNO77_10212 [Canavalia gladiata]|uniref:Uncharacterized protein n=1 Tax=Canavalia gladiata TaxID=3824 RepID=A0AAN9MAP2_CANGL
MAHNNPPPPPLERQISLPPQPRTPDREQKRPPRLYDDTDSEEEDVSPVVAAAIEVHPDEENVLNANIEEKAAEAKSEKSKKTCPNDSGPKFPIFHPTELKKAVNASYYQIVSVQTDIKSPQSKVPQTNTASESDTPRLRNQAVGSDMRVNAGGPYRINNQKPHEVHENTYTPWEQCLIDILSENIPIFKDSSVISSVSLSFSINKNFTS